MKYEGDSMKYAVITGASGGIGQAISERLWLEGWSLLLIARNGQSLAALRQRLCSQSPEQGRQLAWLALDITQPAAAAELTQFLQENQQSVDLLVNAAGCQHFAWLAEQEEAIMRRQVELDLLAPMRLTRALLPAMTSRSTIINLGSTFGEIGYPGFAVYCASKAGVISYCESLRGELRSSGVKVVTLCPGYIDTPLTQKNTYAMPFLMSPEAFSDKAFQTIERGTSYQVIPWQMAVVAKLLRVLPNALLDKALAGRARKARSTDA